MSVAATLSPASLQQVAWDVIIVGAGLAGAFLAYRLARSGKQILLLERKAFPRDKVCGGCLSEHAVSLLHSAGLRDQLEQLPVLPTNRLNLYAPQSKATLELPAGIAVLRAELDAMLVQAAVAAGAHFSPRTNAKICEANADQRWVECQFGSGENLRLSAKIMVAADGLNQSSLPSELVSHVHVSPTSRVGLGAIVQQSESVSDSLDIASNTIHLSIGPEGYVGMVRLPNGKLSVAAALNSLLLAREKSPANVIAHLFRSAGRLPWMDLAMQSWPTATWQGTPPLSRSLTSPAANRLLVLGDAAGYVEPFTGEGMTWALAGAEIVSSLISEDNFAGSDTLERKWVDRHQRLIARRQRLCRSLAWLLRSPFLVHAALRILTIAPRCSAPLVRHWSQPLVLSGDLKP